MRYSGWTLLLLLIAALLGASARAGETEEQTEFFEAKIRPLLATRCYNCHAAKAEKLKGGLRLDSRDGLVKGGDSGTAIVAGKPGESLLIQAVKYQSFEMPPDGKLKPAEIAALSTWVEMGAPWPATQTAIPQGDAKADYNWNAARENHWAFQPIRTPQFPAVKDQRWPQNAVDHFVLEKLEAKGLTPAKPADARVLVRRIYLDLVGLPPAPENVQRFVEAAAQDRPAAIAELVDRLLDSAHYGERWGRHWLDVARYSDGFGGFLDNAALPHAWRYRDWVVDALNRDLPFDRFVALQIAGDLIGDEPQDAVATGFFALGPTYKSDGGDPDSVAQAQGETLDDRVDTLSRAFLALTVSCARCHDHKFDPIPHQDYYSLAGIFNNTRINEVPLASADTIAAYNNHQKAIKDHEQQINNLQNKAKTEKRELTDDEKQRLDALKSELDRLKTTAPPKFDVAHALADAGNSDMKVALRGNLRKPGENAPRRFLRILAGDDPPRFTSGSGRIGLAEAIVSPDNPLTARVIVNRIWQHHFGKALVRTPSNFGSLGQPPTHPELLDWLAESLIESGWSLKQLHRTIMLSAAYQMSHEFDEHNFGIDGDNEFLWRMNPRRLDVETWRDALLSVTGELDPSLGGPPIDDITKSRRRTLYAKVSRNGDQFASDQFLRRFDFPLMRATVAERSTSIVPQQYLFLMNSPFMVERAKALSARVAREAGDDAARIDLAYHLLYARPPSTDESRIGLEYLTTTPDSPNETSLSRWQQYAQVLLSANEFMYLR